MTADSDRSRQTLVTGSRRGDWMLFVVLLVLITVSSWRLRVYFSYQEPPPGASAPRQ
jgi:hypothetical protein